MEDEIPGEQLEVCPTVGWNIPKDTYDENIMVGSQYI